MHMGRASMFNAGGACSLQAFSLRAERVQSRDVRQMQPCVCVFNAAMCVLDAGGVCSMQAGVLKRRRL